MFQLPGKYEFGKVFKINAVLAPCSSKRSSALFSDAIPTLYVMVRNMLNKQRDSFCCTQVALARFF